MVDRAIQARTWFSKFAMWSLLFILLSLSILPFNTACQSLNWQDLLRDADKVSRQGNTTIESIRLGQDSAISMATHILDLLNSSSIDAPCDEARVQIRLGDYNFRLGNWSNALEFWSLATDNANTGCETDSIILQEISMRFGLLITEHGMQTGLQQFNTESVKLYNRLWNSNESDDIPEIFKFAHVYDFFTLWDEFHDLMRKIVQTWEQDRIAYPEYVIRALIYLAEGQSKPGVSNVGNDKIGQDSAIFYGTWALEIGEQTLDSNDTLIAYITNRLGDYHARNGNYNRTLVLWKRAFDINTSFYSPEHIEYQGSIFRMAGIYKSTGQYAKAEPLYLEAVRLREKTQGKGHPETAGMYNQLAHLYHKVSDYEKAELHYRHALSIRERSIERVESDIAQSHLNIGRLYFDMGNFSDAEIEFKTALDLRRLALGDSHTLTASCLTQLARLYADWGRTELADSAFRRAISIKSGYIGTDHPSVAKTKQEYASFLISINQYDLAREMMEESYDYWRRDSIWNQELLIESLSGLGRIAFAAGEINKAEKLFEKALTGKIAFLGIADTRVVAQICDLAQVYLNQSRLDEADSLYILALQFVHENPMVKHPDVARLHEEYSQFCYTYDNNNSLINAEIAVNVRKDHFDQAMTVLTEVEALEYATRLKQSYFNWLSLLLSEQTVHGQRLDKIAYAITNSKGLVTEAISRRLNLQSDGNDEVLRIKDSLKFLSATISNRFIGRLSTDPTDSDIKEWNELISKKNQLESRLAGFDIRYEKNTSVQSVASNSNILKNLPKSTLLIEMLKFPRLVVTNQQKLISQDEYLAITGDRYGWKKVIMLGSALEIDSAIEEYSSHMQEHAISGISPDEQSLQKYKSISKTLSDLLWRPLSIDIRSHHQVIIDGDDKIHQVSFASLMDTDSTYLVEKFKFHYVSDIRDIYQSIDSSNESTGLLAIGDPDFNSSPDIWESNKKSLASFNSPTATSRFSSIRYGCDIFNGQKATRLPASAREINVAISNWKLSTAEQYSKLEAGNAIEGTFKREAVNARIIHIASHAYFISGECMDLIEKQHAMAISQAKNTNPLLLTGILLAGANNINTSWSNEYHEDGFLTAEEVCMLDLSGTQCVILSACETGLGNIISGEGVYGLRRAFQLAGAQSVVSSLWPVSDTFTAFFMNRLYTSAGEMLPDIMRQAALSVIGDLRLRGQPDHPYNWAAFVSCGGTQPILKKSDYSFPEKSLNGKAR